MDEKRLAEDLLKKYLNATATPRETEKVENWYNAYENKKITLSEERKAIIAQRMQTRLQQRIQKGSRSNLLFLQNTSFLRIAATVIIICGVGLGYLRFGVPRAKTATVSAPQLVFATKAGEKKTITLSDGSEITLSAASRITYPKTFSATARAISLTEGEAFFKIAHEEKRSFTVKLADKIYTKVLGTSFSIRAFKSTGELSISVSTGKVAVGNKNQIFGTLIKGQQITYNRAHQSAIISETPIMDSRIVFEKINLRKALQQLEYLYSIKIELAPEHLGDLGCTATFHTTQTPEEILDIICSLHNLKLKMTADHKSFKIYKK